MLKRAKSLHKRINLLIDRRARLWAAATGTTTACGVRIMHSTNDRLQAAIERIVELDAEINKAVDELSDLKAKITHGMEMRDARIVLWRIEGKSWGYIADRLGTTRRGARCIYDSAAQHIAQITETLDSAH